MAKARGRVRRAAKTTSGAITKAGDRLSLGLQHAQTASERAVKSWVKSVERAGYTPDVPTKEMRQVVEASFRSAEKVLKAQRAFALGVIDAIEKSQAKPARKPAARTPRPKAVKPAERSVA